MVELVNLAVIQTSHQRMKLPSPLIILKMMVTDVTMNQEGGRVCTPIYLMKPINNLPNDA
jgi:hypothetical protein